ncbi:hypothetical protein BKA64DRAFT_457820 [Cadophora sp. MPI-SDFR-AT-0126]|nr:hypothetical protein BKA64DRAFT_457820 [Leotiomycetes sp. MPI-SDFR-AT-0126]
MAGPIPNVMSCSMACIKDFFEAEPLVPERLDTLMHSRLAIRLNHLFKFITSIVRLVYSLRYTLIPVIPVFFIFFLAILFTPPPHPIYTIRIPGPKLQGKFPPSPWKPADIAHLQYPWPVSGWIEVRPIRWIMSGCVVIHEGSARWRLMNLSQKERVEWEAERRLWRKEWKRKSWVGKQFRELVTELSYVGTGARVTILLLFVLLCMGVL